jgi:hypothetical protein
MAFQHLVHRRCPALGLADDEEIGSALLGCARGRIRWNSAVSELDGVSLPVCSRQGSRPRRFVVGISLAEASLVVIIGSIDPSVARRWNFDAFRPARGAPPASIAHAVSDGQARLQARDGADIVGRVMGIVERMPVPATCLLSVQVR